VRIAGADYVLVGRASSPQLYALLADGELPAGREWRRRDEVLLVARTAVGGQAIEAAEVLVRGDTIDMRIRLVPGTDAAQFLAVGFLYPQQVGELRHVALAPAGDGDFKSTIAASSLARAPDCEFVPALLMRDGSIRRGKPITARPAPAVLDVDRAK